ncbi:MAG: ABC transporter substrate-binding protein [Rubrivivax sp.]|nr:ABC transporter substrate-binding protein [Rubrivivax sp.]MDH5338857.1 ABC transporter substrate-binding protein [Rubrivivax sp.]
MSLQRRWALALIGALMTAAGALSPALAQPQTARLVLGMVLEPPTLDPTSAAAAAIGEVVHYNILEGLTKVNVDGKVTPLLAQDWTESPDGRSYTFRLRRGVTFSDGKPFTADAVKFSFERAKAEGSTNKAKKAVFNNISRVTVVDAQTVILTLDKADPTMPFRLGENTAVILHPDSAAQAATSPVGTGPYTLAEWKKGSSITLAARADARVKPAIQRVTFRFINDPAAQVAALLAGDIDGMPRFGALQSLKQFQGDRRFTVQIGSTAGKGQLTINNKRKPFDDVRVRRAIMHAIDRQAFIDGVLEGLGRPIGSHFAPTDAGYIDLTGVYPYDPAKARALLKEAGVATPLNVTLTLPPPAYARKGGEVVAAMLAQVGINAKIENVEWAQWLSGPFKGNFDLTIINHVEPLDYAQYTNKDYYWGYDSKVFDALFAAHAGTTNPAERQRFWQDMQRQLTTDAVNAWIFNPSQVMVAKKGLQGLWMNSPIFANDIAAVRWGP